MSDEQKMPWWYPTKDDDGAYTKPYLWDHIGDAVDDYVPLADAFLRQDTTIATLTAEREKLRELVAEMRDDLCVLSHKPEFLDTIKRADEALAQLKEQDDERV